MVGFVCYVGHAYRPHLAIPHVDSAAHALTQCRYGSSGRKLALLDLNTLASDMYIT